MQTVMPHENHVDGFFLPHTHSPEIITFDLIFAPVRIAPTFGAILIPPFISYCKDDITEFHIRDASNNWHSVNQKKRPDTFQTVIKSEPNSDKIDKRGGYSDYSCKGLFKSNVPFWFHLGNFTDSAVFLTSSETSLHWSHGLLAGYLQCKVRLMQCHVLLYCISKGSQAIVMFLSYSDRFVFLLTHLLCYVSYRT